MRLVRKDEKVGGYGYMARQTIPNSRGRDRKGTSSKTPVSKGNIIVAA